MNKGSLALSVTILIIAGWIWLIGSIIYVVATKKSTGPFRYKETPSVTIDTITGGSAKWIAPEKK